MTLTSQDLREILASFDLGHLKKIVPQKTSGNLAFLIYADTGEYVLRLCPSGGQRNPRWRSREEIKAELELIHYLLADDFPAPTPIKKKDGREVVSWKNQSGYLRQFEKAEADLNPSLKKVKIFGETFGLFHNLVLGFRTKNKRLHNWGPENTKKYFPHNKRIILESDFPKKRRFIERIEKMLLSMKFPKNLSKGMIHEDLGKRHVLWENDKISCIIDFDRCYYGFLALDLGQAIRGWCFVSDWKKWSQENFQALIRGYRAKRKLSKLEKDCLFLAIEFGLLERALAFCLRSIEKETLKVKNREMAGLAHRQIFDSVDILDKKRKEIEKFLKEN